GLEVAHVRPFTLDAGAVGGESGRHANRRAHLATMGGVEGVVAGVLAVGRGIAAGEGRTAGIRDAAAGGAAATHRRYRADGVVGRGDLLAGRRVLRVYRADDLAGDRDLVTGVGREAADGASHRHRGPLPEVERARGHGLARALTERRGTR